MKKRLLQAYLDSRRTPVVELEGAQRLHESLREESQQFYLNMLSDKDSHVSHRVAAFAELLRNKTVAGSGIQNRLTTAPANDLLQLLDVVRVYRINGRRARQIGLRALFQRTDIAEIAAAHRQFLRKLVKHLLSERTWSAVQRAVQAENPKDNPFLRRTVLRYAGDQQTAIDVLRFLAGMGFPRPASRKEQRKPWLVIPWLEKKTSQSGDSEFAPHSEPLIRSLAARRDLDAGEGLPKQTLAGIRSVYFPQIPYQRVRELAAPSRTQRVDGPLTSGIKRLLSCDGSAVTSEDNPTTTRHDEIDATVAILLDASASMASSGERANHPAALGQAIAQELESQVSSTTVSRTGGRPVDGVAVPHGQADLASGTLHAVADRPDVVLVITDGFENAREGDVAAVVEGLRALDITTQVIQVIPQFTAAEDIDDRRLGEAIPVLGITHEEGTGELLARIQLASLSDEVSEQDVDLFCRLAL